MALTKKKKLHKSNWSLIFERQNKKKRKRREEKGKRRSRGRGREEEEKRRRKEEQKVWNYGYESGSFDFSCMNTCLGCKKPNPRMNPCMEIITNPFVSLGFCYERT